MTMTDERKEWLHGAYLDRITEVAQTYAATRTHFVDAEWESFIADEFSYLSELTAEDHSYLREQAGYEAWMRIRAVLAEASETAFAKFRHDNGDVIAADASFAIGIGWLSLLQHAADRVRTYPMAWKVALVGGKEKLGCCVLHIACDSDQRGCRSEVERLREEVRLRSLSMCEICGEPGRLRLSTYAKTVCDPHAVVMGEFREDDGLWADPWTWNDDAGRIEDLLEKGRALMSEYPAETAELLRGMDPVRLRPKEHVTDPLRSTPLGERIDSDIERNYGRKADLLLEFCGQIEIAVVAAMSVADDDVDLWLRSEIDRWQGVQPLSDDDREFLRQYLRNVAIDERGRRQRREDGAKALQRFFDDNSSLGREAEQLVGRERELLDAYAGDLADSAHGSVVKEEFLDGYVRDEFALWPDVVELSDDDREWLQRWLRKMIDAEYERIKGNE